MTEIVAPGPLARLRHRVYEVLEDPPEGDRTARAVTATLLCLVVLNLAAVVVETVEPIRRQHVVLLLSFEAFSVAVFSIEYLLRLWSIAENPRYAGAGRLRWMVSPLALVDLAAVLPFFLGSVIDLRELRALRLFRLLRVAKLGRYSESLQSFVRVFRKKKEMLVASVFLVLLLHLFASSALYAAEREAQPEQFGSIPAAMWWGITTLTTVGYGDAVPVTPLGRFLASIAAVMGVGLVALPAGVLAAGFLEEVELRRARERRCPHCGGTLPSSP